MISLKKQWFSVAILLIIFLAHYLSLTNFKLSSTYSSQLKGSFIILIFFLSGLSINYSKLLKSMAHWRAHVLIQTVSFIFFPILVVGVASIIGRANGQNFIYVGFVMLACVPTTISSCVVFTHNAGGNQECALFNATIGNMLGIIVTPLLILLIIGRSIEIDTIKVMEELMILVFLPFVTGQICQKFIHFKINSSFIKSASNGLILGILFIVFMDTSINGINVSTIDIFVIICLATALKIFFLSLVWSLSSKFETFFTLSDRKCLTITATQKTLALAIPMISVLFPENSDMALISLPIIIYHTVQLVIDGIVVTKLAEYPEDNLS